MRKLLFVTGILSILVIESFAQPIQSVSQLKLKDGKYKIVYNGEEFDANDSILTIKPKSESFRNLKLKIVRENKLGYIDIRIPKDRNIVDFANELRETGLFDEVEYNSFGEYLSFTPDDPWLSYQWYLSAINVFDAWDFTTGDPSIVVAVLDSGTDWLHDDLGMANDGYQNINLNPDEDDWTYENIPLSGNDTDDDNNGKEDDWKGWNFVNNGNDSRPEYNSHGTAMAGIISAKTNNDFGIAGIAGGNSVQGVKILPINIGYESPDFSVIDDAIIYAVDNGANVIQLSAKGSENPDINAAILYAWTHNVLIVCTSGNTNIPVVSYPASRWEVIAVGATTTSNFRLLVSPYGTALDIVAPGEDIYSTVLNNSFFPYTGTSLAAPQVSAVAALILSLNNSLGVEDVKDILESTAMKIEDYTFTEDPLRYYPWNDEVGYGLLDAHAALQAAVCYKNIDNTVYSSNVTLTGCDHMELKNVTVKGGAKLTIDADTYINIRGPFQIDLGSSLELK